MGNTLQCCSGKDQFTLKVIKKELITHDTYSLRLENKDVDWISGLWAGGHYILHADINGKHYKRKYTPISVDIENGVADFPVKVYRKSKEYPKGGVYTQFLENNINVGDHIICEGPVGKIRYLGPGKFRFNLRFYGYDLKPKTNVFLCAGGSGLTPLLSTSEAKGSI